MWVKHFFEKLLSTRTHTRSGAATRHLSLCLRPQNGSFVGAILRATQKVMSPRPALSMKS